MIDLKPLMLFLSLTLALSLSGNSIDQVKAAQQESSTVPQDEDWTRGELNSVLWALEKHQARLDKIELKIDKLLQSMNNLLFVNIENSDLSLSKKNVIETDSSSYGKDRDDESLISETINNNLQAFRSYLSKLMTRVVDTNYQYNTISNQLSSIKEECSLAASLSHQSSNADTDKKSSFVASSQIQQPTISINNLKHEINELLIEDTTALNMSLQKRFNEIDSVVKQTALQVTKLWQSNKPSSEAIFDVSTSNLSGSQFDESAVESQLLPKNNLPKARLNSTAKLPSIQPTSIQQQASRWQSGSKIPFGASFAEPNNKQATKLSQQSDASAPNCKSRTKLAAPQSCQHLRRSGANCSGSYYIFVNGSIKHVYCDMDNHNNGWLVILQRVDRDYALAFNSSSSFSTGSETANAFLKSARDKPTSFDLDWYNYKIGFGDFGNDLEEFFVGLDFLNELTKSTSARNANHLNKSKTARQELLVEFEEQSGSRSFVLFDEFSVLNESQHFQLSLGAANDSRLGAALLRLNSSFFFTADSPSVEFGSANNSQLADCRLLAARGGFGWWLNAALGDCNDANTVALDSLLIPTRQLSSHLKQHLFWPITSDDPHLESKLSLRKLTFKVRETQK